MRSGRLQSIASHRKGEQALMHLQNTFQELEVVGVFLHRPVQTA